MKLVSIKIDNYRNLGNLEFVFNDELNFIIGENNLGKSNFIDLLEALFSTTRFSEHDFYDIEKSICIDFTLQLSPVEKPLFSVKAHRLKITAVQKNPDANIVYEDAKTKRKISVETIRCVNFFRDASLIEQGVQFQFSRFENFGKIYRHYKANYGSFETLDMSKKILRSIEFIILEKIFSMSKTRKEKIQEAFYTGVQKRTKTYDIPIMLAFDELEIHLHPYMQRSIVRTLNKIITNEKSFFREVLKKELNIRHFYGQVFIVTHSPNILLNDYKQFIRFYLTNGKSAVVCGENIHVQNDKHLFKNFIYFKEAFFAKFVIVVEGDSEFAAIPEFAEKILGGNDFDTYGILVIKADGKTSVSLVMKILQAFKINNLGMVDRDDDDIAVIQSRLHKKPHLYTTHFRDFEEELLEKLTLEHFSLLDPFLFSTEHERDTLFSRTMRDELYCKKKIEKYALPIDEELMTRIANTNPSFADYAHDREIMKLWYLSELNRRKGISFWHQLAYELPEQFIPDIYRKIILEATEVE